jgi:hypothetical protein
MLHAGLQGGCFVRAWLSQQAAMGYFRLLLSDRTSNKLFVSINLELLTLPPKERKAVDMMTWRHKPVALNGVVAAACHNRLSRSIVSVVGGLKRNQS